MSSRSRALWLCVFVLLFLFVGIVFMVGWFWGYVIGVCIKSRDAVVGR